MRDSIITEFDEESGEWEIVVSPGDDDALADIFIDKLALATESET